MSKEGVVHVNYKPGQRKEAPPPGAGTRVFYESLYKQRPSSMMALKWCLDHGILPEEDCDRLLIQLEKMKAKAKRHQSADIKPIKYTKTKKPKLEHPEMDTEMVGDQSEGIGTIPF
uniref:Uncharacterized protein n=1 Tax=Mucochytrium quahogii TaxID=96639 RepID=A0A7S2RJJ4_9STRA|mmetsp:Transcript_16392/g.28434  ORF Transcript_16392/g.28434 Transcript_16392/m.28434 type:complete len:116 (-) Transcript_16392:3164-3511(-)|eukprot:CAMPEP_0203782290 /NCGR_PEP_ID=MMETSP0099_2-20121227/10904_1 /ASSEMBLY_ACC=CAM_ASM_000209 /TAXON_ID=96639 /ORGANISM=" , Strain NY0313808BC1" /LENGTH=115 /DNA_ID=CAMNT_0050683761 /DNA_START=648 /DNA_END=995 /DNA_ORIENTATION=+